LGAGSVEAVHQEREQEGAEQSEKGVDGLGKERESRYHDIGKNQQNDGL
jgi:hypothetical protein